MAGTWCVIPVKTLARAKQRLAPALSPSERAELVKVMATDVIRAARSTVELAGVAVVTPDAQVAAIARDEGAHVIAEPAGSGLNEALSFATRELIRLGATSIVILSADVPQVMPADIAGMIRGHGKGRFVAIARAESDGGSNALACTPPDVIPFCFGEESFHAHCHAARAGFIEPAVQIGSRLAHDIDRPADLEAFLRQPSETLSYVYLAGLALDQAATVLRSTNDA